MPIQFRVIREVWDFIRNRTTAACLREVVYRGRTWKGNKVI